MSDYGAQPRWKSQLSNQFSSLKGYSSPLYQHSQGENKKVRIKLMTFVSLDVSKSILSLLTSTVSVISVVVDTSVLSCSIPEVVTAELFDDS